MRAKWLAGRVGGWLSWLIGWLVGWLVGWFRKIIITSFLPCRLQIRCQTLVSLDTLFSRYVVRNTSLRFILHFTRNQTDRDRDVRNTPHLSRKTRTISKFAQVLGGASASRRGNKTHGQAMSPLTIPSIEGRIPYQNEKPSWRVNRQNLTCST
jgi:hypothetical protein